MNLVDKEYGGAAAVEERGRFCLFDYFAYILYTCRYGIESVEGAVELVGNDFCKGGLACSRRTP